jgi:RNA polymerase sigma-70 factor (ECF subfamily)
MTDGAADSEQRIRGACTRAQWEAAATATLEAYGDEIASFLGSRLRSVADAGDAFSMFAEDLWVGLPSFAWRCSMRTWAYTLARNVAARYGASPERRPERALSFAHAEQFGEFVERARSSTRVYQRTEVKDRFRALREQLDGEDQMLLVLRVDRNLSWRDLALTISGDPNLDGEPLERESARLRKAFERVKSELRRLAEREGLLKARD